MKREMPSQFQLNLNSYLLPNFLLVRYYVYQLTYQTQEDATRVVEDLGLNIMVEEDLGDNTMVAEDHGQDLPKNIMEEEDLGENITVEEDLGEHFLVEEDLGYNTMVAEDHGQDLLKNFKEEEDLGENTTVEDRGEDVVAVEAGRNTKLNGKCKRKLENGPKNFKLIQRH